MAILFTPGRRETIGLGVTQEVWQQQLLCFRTDVDHTLPTTVLGLMTSISLLMY